MKAELKREGENVVLFVEGVRELTLSDSESHVAVQVLKALTKRTGLTIKIDDEW